MTPERSLFRPASRPKRPGVAALLAMLIGLGAAGVQPAAASAASLADGVWMTANGKGAVEIRSCDDRLCGYVADASYQSRPEPGVETDPGAGKKPEAQAQLLANFSGGPRQWSGGMIRDPRNGRAYTGTLQLVDPTTLRITGCLVGPICASQVWKRIK